MIRQWLNRNVRLSQSDRVWLEIVFIIACLVLAAWAFGASLTLSHLF